MSQSMSHMTHTPTDHTAQLHGIKPVNAPLSASQVARNTQTANDRRALRTASNLAKTRASNEANYKRSELNKGLRTSVAGQRNASCDAVLRQHLDKANHINACADKLGSEHPLIKRLSPYLALADNAVQLGELAKTELGARPSLPLVDPDFPLATKGNERRNGADAMRDSLPQFSFRELEPYITDANRVAQTLVTFRRELIAATGVGREVLLKGYTAILEEVLTHLEDWEEIVESMTQHDREKLLLDNKTRALQTSIAGLGNKLTLVDQSALEALEVKMYELEQAKKQQADSATKPQAKAKAKATKTTNKDD